MSRDQYEAQIELHYHEMKDAFKIVHSDVSPCYLEMYSIIVSRYSLHWEKCKQTLSRRWFCILDSLIRNCDAFNMQISQRSIGPVPQQTSKQKNIVIRFNSIRFERERERLSPKNWKQYIVHLYYFRQHKRAFAHTS